MDNNAVAAAFLALVPVERQPRTETALRNLFAAAAAGSIYNQELKNLKLTLDYAAAAAWNTVVGPFWHGKGGNLDVDFNTNEALNDLHRSVTGIHSVRESIAASKKLAKAKVSHPMVDAMNKVAAAALPVALVIEDLKTKVVMGRKPNPEAQARKAASLDSMMNRATCACCFRGQAVLPNGKIHDHGYSLPDRAWKTGSCYGRGFRPLEVSNEGLHFMVGMLTQSETAQVADLAKVKAAKKLTETDFHRKEHVYTPEMPEWARKHAAAVAEAERALEMTRRDLVEFKKHVAEWKPGKVKTAKEALR
jgi:hypothetical protein